jgi:excinuclease ABC subunit A
VVSSGNLPFYPQGGVGGGELVAEGTPDQVAEGPRSYTGKYLAPLLKPRKVPQAAE